MNNRREQLLHWVCSVYEGKKIKKSKAPYVEHLIAVAQTVEPCFPLAYECGLCHDLLEDITITVSEFAKALQSVDYLEYETKEIIRMVTELTDVYTKAAYPKLSKAGRKTKEQDRLLKISGGAQTIKYADILYNADWMRTYKPEKLFPYLERKYNLVTKLNKGDGRLQKMTLTNLKPF